MMTMGRLWDNEHKQWVGKGDEPIDDKSKAVLVTRKTWKAVYKSKGFEFIECGEDEKMRMLDMPTLPGFE